MTARNDLVTLVARSINNGHHPQSWTKTVPGLTTLGQHAGLHPQDWKGDSANHMAGLVKGTQITLGLPGMQTTPTMHNQHNCHSV